MAILKNGPNLYRKLLSASVALVKANASGFSVHFAYSLFAPTMRTNWAIWPDSALNKRIGFFLVLKVNRRNY